MKNQLITLIVLALLSLTACDEKKSEEPREAKETTEKKEMPDYAAFDEKVEVIRSFIKAHENEDLEAQRGFLADTLKWSPPIYNENKWMGKSDFLAALENYHKDYENIKFEEGIKMADVMEDGMWSGSVFPKEKASSSPDAIRVYGTWKAKHTASGKDIGLKWFGLCWVNDAGQIAQFSTYFDAHGLEAQVAAKK